MSVNILKLSVVLAALASAVYAANMFMASPGNPGAAQAVMLVGVAIFLFTLLLSLGALVAGVCLLALTACALVGHSENA